MNIVLKIIKIKQLESPTYFDLLKDNSRTKFNKSISYEIQSINDYLFGIVKVLFVSEGLLFNRTNGFSLLRNIQLTQKKGEFELPVWDKKYLYKTDFYGEKEELGSIILEYTVESEGNTFEILEHSFVFRLFDLFLTPRKSSLVKNLKGLTEEASRGSPLCKLNIFWGIYGVDKYMSYLNYKFTANIDFKTILHLSFYEVDLDSFPSTIWREDELEGVLIRGKYNYTKTSFGEFLKNRKSKERFKIFKIEKEKKKVALNLLSFRTFLKYVLTGGSEEEEIFFPNCETEVGGGEKEVEGESIQELTLDSLQRYLKPIDSNLKRIEDLFSNEGFVCIDKPVLKELLNVFYFALGSYGNTWPTTFLERRNTIDPLTVPDPYKRAILETLNIEEDLLLVVSLKMHNIPDYIIFYDNKSKRIVLSFKGTSTSDETLHDLNCTYSTFYEGVSHKGIKKLALNFIEKKSEELKVLLKVFGTKELLITGHSLGGSLASLIHIICRREGIFKGYKITTIAFSSPPVISYNLTNRDYGSLFSVNYGNDLVPVLALVV